uniref:2-hydroxyacyl-CoA dehydratase n=1 Tax=candidate division WOR-3 bacterium TaxID=2052148 RepID=A0A7V3PSH3_UNCW3
MIDLNINYQDPKPARISFEEWDDLFQRIPDALIEKFHYFPQNTEAWSKYLFPPQIFYIYGARHLRRLKFDNSLAALRLWGFINNESERLFRARQIGKKIIAVMGDLGPLAVLVHAFPDCVPFYPDCWWWTPFAMESTVLLDAAAQLGIGEATCYSRAALGAFAKHSYFPDPDLIFAATGASCDDYSGVESLVAKLTGNCIWVETPLRLPEERDALVNLLIEEYQRVIKALQELTGVQFTESMLHASISRTNQVRRLTANLRQLAYQQALLPALEMMLIEFGCLHCYSDINEWIEILKHLTATAEYRRQTNQPVLNPAALRLAWLTPPADPLLLTYVEDQDARLVATEYVINQALTLLDESQPALTAIALSHLNGSLNGAAHARAALLLSGAEANSAEGLIISGILGGSHCAMESRLIGDIVKASLKIPVLEFDVAPPHKEIDRQTRTRIDAFLELLRIRRCRKS